MYKKVFDLLFYFGLMSIVLGLYKIVEGILDYNSILKGLGNSYYYFLIGLLIIGFIRLIELLEEIKELLQKD